LEAVTVIKMNPAREETWRYTGQVVERSERSVLLQALFNREDTPFHEIVLKRNDEFLEIYYSDRWYNIYEIYDRDDGRVKGWYCNVSQPAEFAQGVIRFVDLALDLLVYPDGRQLVLDEDEFASLSLSEDMRDKARQALDELKRTVQPKKGFRLDAGLGRLG
jgi:protein associated with RNAse G/E